MRKIVFLTLVALCLGMPVFAQGGSDADSRKQAILDKMVEKEQANEARAQVLHGWRFGGLFSARSFGGVIESEPGQKLGLHLTAGYRFTKHWYVGTEAGVDVTLPMSITNYKNRSLERSDKMYFPIMIEPRFYFNYTKFEPYFFFDYGIEFSTSGYSPTLGLAGIGFDVHLAKKHCLNFALGVGFGGWETVNTSGLNAAFGGVSGYYEESGLSASFRIGWSF